jgi:hypothetical protein
MATEDLFKTRMVADSTLMAILDGGVYAAGETGINGITRETAPGAFDANGYLEPAALVRQRGNVPDGNVRDGMAQVTSAIQVVEIYVYQDSGYDQIDLALARLYDLFEGYQFANSFPAELVNIIDRQRDTGALAGASLARMDFAVYNIIS